MTKLRKVRARTEAIRAFIETVADQADGANVAKQTAEKFGISRQAAHQHLKRLQEEGVLESTGNTRKRRYKLAELSSYTHVFALKGLEEGTVWREHFFYFMQPVQ